MKIIIIIFFCAAVAAAAATSNVWVNSVVAILYCIMCCRVQNKYIWTKKKSSSCNFVLFLIFLILLFLFYFGFCFQFIYFFVLRKTIISNFGEIQKLLQTHTLLDNKKEIKFQKIVRSIIRIIIYNKKFFFKPKL